MSAPVSIHAESARVGVKLALLVMQGKVPDDDTVRRILTAAPNQNLILAEFPLEVIGLVGGARMERRRAFAAKALECLLIRSGESTLLSNEELDGLVTKAWHIAAAMEREDSVAQQLESVGKKG